jgi:hypothetical protein
MPLLRCKIIGFKIVWMRCSSAASREDRKTYHPATNMANIPARYEVITCKKCGKRIFARLSDGCTSWENPTLDGFSNHWLEVRTRSKSTGDISTTATPTLIKNNFHVQ